jgi:hypothetical protein
MIHYHLLGRLLILRRSNMGKALLEVVSGQESTLLQ